MNWHHWHKQLSSLADEMSDCYQRLAAASKLQNHIWLAEEFRWRKLIDEICTNYAETRSWPINLDQVQANLIYFRVIEAEIHAEKMAQYQRVHSQSSAELDSEKSTALKYLLVDYWHSGGRVSWLAR